MGWAVRRPKRDVVLHDLDCDRPAPAELILQVLYFDVAGRHDKPRFRLVYRVLASNEIEVVTAEVVAIGLRKTLTAYMTAARRLGRFPIRD